MVNLLFEWTNEHQKECPRNSHWFTHSFFKERAQKKRSCPWKKTSLSTVIFSQCVYLKYRCSSSPLIFSPTPFFWIFSAQYSSNHPVICLKMRPMKGMDPYQGAFKRRAEIRLLLFVEIIIEKWATISLIFSSCYFPFFAPSLLSLWVLLVPLYHRLEVQVLMRPPVHLTMLQTTIIAPQSIPARTIKHLVIPITRQAPPQAATIR